MYWESVGEKPTAPPAPKPRTSPGARGRCGGFGEDLGAFRAARLGAFLAAAAWPWRQAGIGLGGGGWVARVRLRGELTSWVHELQTFWVWTILVVNLKFGLFWGHPLGK